MPPPQTGPIPLPDSGPGSWEYWDTQVKWATDIRKDQLDMWRKNAKAYSDSLKPSRPEGVRVNIEFEKTEQKRWQLFFRQPAIRLRAHPRTIRDSFTPDPSNLNPQTGQPQPRDLKTAIAIFREVISQAVGDQGAQLKYTMDEIVFDLLCPAGIGFVKVGYERYTHGEIPIQIGQQPDPRFEQPGAVLGLSLVPPMVPIMGSAPNVIAERYYANRISPANALLPPEFRESNYSRAKWLGYDFWITEDEAQRRGWDIEDGGSHGSDPDDDDRIIPLERKGHRSHQIHCRALYYYPLLVDGSDPNPDKIRTLIFAGNRKTPVVHTDFKDQVFDQRGRFQKGLKTLPIKVLTLRYVSDTAYPPSDCTISRTQGDELSEYRTVMKLHRRKAVPLEWMDFNGIVDERVKELVRKGEWMDIVPTDGPGDRFMGAIPRPAFPQDNYRANDYFMGDVNRLWALGANQSSTTEKSSPTATEIASIQQATANRLGGEREKVTNQFYCGIVADIGALIQLYADEEAYVEIVGPDGARALQAWNKDTIRGEFLYDIVPNSALAPDAAADRDLALNRYNLVRNDPCINPEQLLRDTLEAYDTEDVDKLVHPVNPPQPPPEKHSITLSLNGKDLDPASAQYPNVVEICKAAGIALPQPLPPEQVTPAPVVDRERMRMAATDNADQRAGGLSGVGIGRKP